MSWGRRSTSLWRSFFIVLCLSCGHKSFLPCSCTCGCWWPEAEAGAAVEAEAAFGKNSDLANWRKVSSVRKIALTWSDDISTSTCSKWSGTSKAQTSFVCIIAWRKCILCSAGGAAATAYFAVMSISEVSMTFAWCSAVHPSAVKNWTSRCRPPPELPELGAPCMIDPSGPCAAV